MLASQRNMVKTESTHAWGLFSSNGGQEAVAQPAAVPSSPSVPIYSQVTKKKDRKKAKENIIGHEMETAHVQGLCGTIGGQEVVSKTVAQPVAVASSPSVPIIARLSRKGQKRSRRNRHN